MDTQEIHVPENSDCITLGLQSSICIGCTYLKNDRKLKPKKKRTQKQTCAKQWEKKNLSHRSLQKATHCQQSRIELQELGYGSVGNLCNKPAGPSYGTPAFTRRRATKRFIDALTPRSVIKVQREDTGGGKNKVRGADITVQERTNQEQTIGFLSPSKIANQLRRAKRNVFEAISHRRHQIPSSAEEDSATTRLAPDKEQLIVQDEEDITSTSRTLFHSTNKDHEEARISPDPVTEDLSLQQNNHPRSEHNSSFSIASADISNKDERDKIVKMLLDIFDLAAKDPECSFHDIIFSGAERLSKAKPGSDAVEFKRKDNPNHGFALFASGYNSFKSWTSGLDKQRREASKLEAASSPPIFDVATAANKTPNRFQQFVSFLGKGQTDDELDNEPIGASYILRGMKRWYPSSTKNFVDNEVKNTAHNKMSATETASILSFANISMNAWKHVSRLIRAFKGLSLSASEKELKQFSNRAPHFHSDFFEYEFDKLKDKERINYFVIEIQHLVEMLVARELTAKLEDYPILLEEESSEPESENLPRYGYKTHAFGEESDNGDGVYALFTSDHGKGASLGAIRLLLESSDKRKEIGNADYGTISFPFCMMVCKKDPGEVIEVLAPYVNRGFEALKESKLIAARNTKNEVRCFLIPKDASVVTVEKCECDEEGTISFKLYCRYTNAAGESLAAEADAFEFDTDHLEFWTAINNFDSCGIADLLFVLTAQGREGHASHRCMRCNLKQSEWSDKDPDPDIVARDLTLADLNPDNLETLGCKTWPIWNLCPYKWIQPVMHEGMGMVNKVYFKMVRTLLTKLDCLSPEEAGLRLELENLLDLHETTEDHLKSFDHNLALTRHKLTKERAQLQRQKKKGQKTGDDEMIKIADRGLIRIVQEREKLKEDRRKLKNDIDDVADTLTDIHSKLKVFVDDRLKATDTLDGKLEKILQHHSVIIKAFHGGHLTGMACRTFLTKEEAIMNDIKKVCHEIRDEREKEDLPFTIISKDELDELLLLYSETFQLLDATFAGLRIIAPTEEEINFTHRAIKLLKHYWVDKLKLSITPKAHMVFEHAINDKGTGDMQMFGGLGDKTDEWGEKWHQTMGKARDKVRGMIGFKNQSKTIIKNLWRDSDPRVRRKLEEGLQSTARGVYNKEGKKSKKTRNDTRRANVFRIESKYSA